jgi:uridylate kinase
MAMLITLNGVTTWCRICADKFGYVKFNDPKQVASPYRANVARYMCSSCDILVCATCSAGHSPDACALLLAVSN